MTMMMMIKIIMMTTSDYKDVDVMLLIMTIGDINMLMTELMMAMLLIIMGDDDAVDIDNDIVDLTGD